MAITINNVRFKGINVYGTSLPTDPYFSYVTLLTHLDGTNNSTVFIDNSNLNVTISGNGNAKLKTDQYKFGSASGYFDGNSSYLAIQNENVAKFGTQDFTIECWLYPVARTQSYPTVWSNYSSWPSANALALFAGHAGGNTSKYQVLAATAAFPVIQSTDDISYNTWQHIALVRNGLNITLYVNGINNGSTTVAGSLTFNDQFWIGVTGDAISSAGFNGYIDDFRITIGVARYTANFTPPTEAFPNS